MRNAVEKTNASGAKDPKQRDIYAEVTGQIIEAVEQGMETWRMPWHVTGEAVFSPVNVASKRT